MMTDRKTDDAKPCIVIGIAGGTGSGKTTLARHISEKFGDRVTVIKYDNYYKRHDGMTYDERAALNYDCPEAFDTALMIEQIQQLKAGKSVMCPVYDFRIHNRSDETVLITPTPVIIIEGILIFHQPELCSLMDIRIFVETDDDVRLIRRILRDTRERARSLDSVVEQYLSTVKPMHEQYVQPSRRNAHIIVPEGGHNLIAIDMIISRIQKQLN